MCKRHNPRKIDKCLEHVLRLINTHTTLKTLASCCGHGKYPMTIIVYEFPKGEIFEYFSEVEIPRKRRFYVKDKKGYYYIPEIKK